METTPIASTPATAITTPAPAPAVAPTPAPAAPMVQAQPTMADGGMTSDSGGSKNFFSSLNWMEVGFSILGVAALTYVIYYYRFKMKQDKMVNNELQRQIDELKMNLQSSMKGKYKSI